MMLDKLRWYNYYARQMHPTHLGYIVTSSEKPIRPRLDSRFNGAAVELGEPKVEDIFETAGNGRKIRQATLAN